MMTQTQTKTRGDDARGFTQEAENARLERQREWYRIVDAIRAAAKAAGVGEMSMEEIDEEIAACRRERRECAHSEYGVK